METEQRKRIAMVVRPAAGGIRRHVTQLCLAFETKYEIFLHAPFDFTLDREEPIAYFAATSIGATTNPIRDWRTIRSLAGSIRINEYRWIHAHGLRGALIGVLAAKRAGVPAFFTAHNLVVKSSWLQKQIVKYLGNTANQVIAVSHAVKKSLIACGVSPGNITVIPNGIDLAEIDTAVPFEPLPFQGKIVAAIGRLSPEKGFDLLIQAFGKVSSLQPDAHLVIAGTGTQEAELKALAAAQTHAAKIHFLGYVANTANVYRSADVVAVPSREEGQGIVAIEAMGHRKPVVAFDVGGLGETLVSGHTGLLAAPEHIEIFAEQLLNLLRDDALQKRMGEAGRKRVEAEYTVEKMVERIEAVYREAQ